MCPLAPEKLDSQTASTMPRCHENKQQTIQESRSEAAVPMLISDCLGLDIFHQLQSLSPLDKADTANEAQPLQPLHITYHLELYEASEGRLLRAPPNLVIYLPISPPIYFSTQRIRI